MVLKPEKWSPTYLNQTRVICKRAWEMKMQGKPVEVVIPEFEAGKELHEYATEYLRTGNKDYLKHFNPVVAKDLELIRGYSGKLQVELEVEDELIKGQIDCAIETPMGWVVIDFKSRYEQGIKREDKVQLLCYLYLLQKKYPLQGNSHRIGILAFHNNYNPLAMEFAEYDVNYLTDYVKRQIKLAEQRLEYLQINTSWCKFCEYIMSCDVKEKRVETVEDIAQQYIQLKELLKRYEETLKRYVDSAGKNIVIGNLEVGMHTRQKTIVDASLLKKICSDANIPVEQVFRPDIYAIKKLAKNIPDLANAVSYEYEYVFGVRKKEEEGGEE